MISPNDLPAEVRADDVTIELPIRVVSENNAHEHWRVRQKRAKGQRNAVGLTMLLMRSETVRSTARHPLPAFPVSVQFTRLAPRTLDDDNLVGAFKHVRDGVADAYGVDDGDPRWKWLPPKQEKAKEYGIRIEITSI